MEYPVSNKKYLFFSTDLLSSYIKSNYKNFIKFGEKFVPLLSKASYVKSSYVVRCVDISKFNQDRNTSIKQYGSKIISVFSGKWNNCVKVSKQIKKLI